MSFLSFSVIVGKSTFTPGRFMFFLSPSFALFSHFTCTVPFPTSHESTVNVMLPSAHRDLRPGRDVSRERRVRHRDQILVPVDVVIRRERDFAVLLEHHRLAVVEHPRSDLRPFRVEENPQRVSRVFTRDRGRYRSVSWWYSCVPCEKLNRATVIPALSIFSMIVHVARRPDLTCR